MKIQTGFQEEASKDVAQIYAHAFKRKFENVIGDEDTVSKMIEGGLNPNCSLICYQEDQVVGLLGFHMGKNSFINIGLSDFIKEFGLIKGFLKGLASEIIFYRKPVVSNELLMDGIAVKENFRGKGIGTKLFDELFLWARKNEYRAIHLDVIDENEKAKALYQRLGFEDVSYEKMPAFIQRLIGVSGVTHMRKAI